MDNQQNTPTILVNQVDDICSWSWDDDAQLHVLTIHGKEPARIAFTPAALIRLGQNYLNATDTNMGTIRSTKDENVDEPTRTSVG